MATFSKSSFDAVRYAASRPSYPPALYDHVTSYALGQTSSTQSRTLLDLGCGPGLSTFPFASYFDKLIGIDPSLNMVKAASDMARARSDQFECEVRFEQGSSEDLSGVVEDHSVDLVVAAQAAHWFDPARVYAEVARVLKPGGAFAFWGYGEAFFPDRPALSELVPPYSHGKLDKYWQQPGRSIVEHLLTPFPLPSSTPSDPNFEPASFQRTFFLAPGAKPPKTMDNPPARTTKVLPLLLTKQWTLQEVEGYLRTWSSAHAYQEKHPDEDPVAEMVKQLKRAGFTADETVQVAWELGIVMGKTNLR
ncbi:trans-aconitate methyltransferase 1 [Microbotryomycetes sp. JL201]|nr:trans-aconitate methyltransferase 1 [Microbotryomycetes sp. JL201]